LLTYERLALILGPLKNYDIYCKHQENLRQV
jgi:hypothetical protein